jgi:hypothetical protein
LYLVFFVVLNTTSGYYKKIRRFEQFNEINYLELYYDYLNDVFDDNDNIHFQLLGVSEFGPVLPTEQPEIYLGLGFASSFLLFNPLRTDFGRRNGGRFQRLVHLRKLREILGKVGFLASLVPDHQHHVHQHDYGYYHRLFRIAERRITQPFGNYPKQMFHLFGF